MPPVSIVFTVKNEAVSLPVLLDSIVAQTRSPDQVVCVDGGSTDDTLGVLKAYAGRLPLCVRVHPGANISEGRNAAIRHAAGELIAVTDAGVRLDPNWLEEIVRPLESGPAAHVDVAAGLFLPDPKGAFELALAAVTLPATGDIRPERFLPSSRSVAMRKTAWLAAGGYPEWLDYCEDLVLDLALKARGCCFAFVPAARVWFRPRPTLRAFFNQYFHYAYGDGQANLWFRRHVVRYAFYLLLLPIVWQLFRRGMAGPGFSLLAVGGLGLFFTPYKRLAILGRGKPVRETVLAVMWIPLVRITGDLAKMLGYPAGLLWAWTRRAEIPATYPRKVFK